METNQQIKFYNFVINESRKTGLWKDTNIKKI